MADQTFEVSGTVTEHLTADNAPDVKTERQAAAWFRATRGKWPDWVNGARVVGYCVQSGEAVFDDDQYDSDYEDGILILTKKNPEHDEQP